MSVFWQDIRYGLRILGKNPDFAVIAVLTLALGIGANTALFSVVHGVLIKPMPYENPEQLVDVYWTTPNDQKWPFSFPDFLDGSDRTIRSRQLRPIITLFAVC